MKNLLLSTPFLIASVALLLSACGGGSSSSSAPIEVSDVGLTNTNPAAFSSNVDRDTSILAIFSGDLFAPSVDNNSVQLFKNDEPVAANVSLVLPNIIDIQTERPLDLLSNYIPIISRDVTDLEGRLFAIDALLFWPFVTRDGIWRDPVAFNQSTNSPPVLITDNEDITWGFYQRANGFTGENEIFAKVLQADNTWSIDQLVSNGVDDEDVASKPQVVVLANGDLLAVWEELGPGATPTQIGYNRYSQDNNSWGDSQLISGSALIAPQMNPQLASNDQGDTMVAFEVDFAGNADIVTRRYDIDNDKWQDNIVIDSLDEEAGHPRISINEAGEAMVIWYQNDRVYSSHYAGNAWSAATTIDNFLEDSVQPGLQLVHNSRGDFMALWSQDDNGFLRSFIWFNRHVRGQGWDVTAKIIPNSDYGYRPEVVINRDDNMIAVWQRATTEDDLMFSGFNILDDEWTDGELLESNDQPASEHRLIVDNSGNIMAVWNQNREGLFFNLNGDNFLNPPTIWVRRFDNTDGGEWTAATSISEFVDEVNSPAITNNSSGETAVLWGQNNDGEFSIQSRYFD